MIGIQLSADYEPRIRLARDEEGRVIEGLTLGETLPQNQALILTLHQGELKEAPAVGCGISDMLLDNQPLYWRARIREQLEMDGQTVDSVKITTSGISIDAHY
jgi:hypothetical protein